MPTLFAPPAAPLAQLHAHVQVNGFAVLDAPDAPAWLGCNASDLLALQDSWGDLADDHYLKDGGRYRKRRHSCAVVTQDSVRKVAHRAHWQPLAYNALHGGMQRWFEPVSEAAWCNPAWQALLQAGARVASALRGEQPWFVEAHQFRIDTSDGIGRPTPEGAHRDGVDVVMVCLVSRVGVKGGESRVFEANGPSGQRFTMQQPWTVLLLDDAKMIHETTPIQPTDAHGWRDTLVLTFRAGGFQGDGEADVAAAAAAGSAQALSDAPSNVPSNAPS